MMLLRVQDLLSRQQPLELAGSLDLTDLFRDSRDVSPLGPLVYRLVAQASNRVIHVTGELDVDMQLLCSRCLDPIDVHFALPFEEQFRVMKPTDPPPDEEADFVPVTEDQIELDSLLEEELVVNLPLAPLCSDACKGLCPTCGTNRNEQDCACASDRIDPRLEALQHWFKSEE